MEASLGYTLGQTHTHTHGLAACPPTTWDSTILEVGIVKLLATGAL